MQLIHTTMYNYILLHANDFESFISMVETFNHN